ncbi:hypothetical protein ADIS_3231 [Lunatimonas lonarensis]|uniref:Uncharacterized protein n=1 Tax=Lunatimonas lonarensis TaxID=1232681 RepID=R7ZPY3_9BACT|nr:hypothetical protein ADIS_3231 [Lunatimonas lonarensis]
MYAHISKTVFPIVNKTKKTAFRTVVHPQIKNHLVSQVAQNANHET